VSDLELVIKASGLIDKLVLHVSGLHNRTSLYRQTMLKIHFKITFEFSLLMYTCLFWREVQRYETKKLGLPCTVKLCLTKHFLKHKASLSNMCSPFYMYEHPQGNENLFLLKSTWNSYYKLSVVIIS